MLRFPACRQAEGENGAFSGGRGHCDLAAHGNGDVLHDGQTQAGAPTSRERALSTR